MSLFGAMNTAIRGLNAQSAAFSNIGDNVANSQTIGFKRVDTSFANYLTTSNAKMNESGSVVARPEYVNDVQGTVVQTDKPLAMAIAGQGFFAVSRQVGNAGSAPVFNPTKEYTRSGDFALNKDGYVVNGFGQYLNGWGVDSATGAVDHSSIAPIQVNQGAYNPVPTSQLTLSANLPATPTPGTPIVSQVQVYDSLGTLQTVRLSWTPAASGPDDWTVALDSPGGNPTALGSARVQFGAASGTAAPEGTVGLVTGAGGLVTGSSFTPGQDATLGFTADFGRGPQTINVNLGAFGQPNGLTQFAGTEFSLRSITQNGVAPGSFSGLATKSNGDLVVNYDNGQSRTIARVPVTTFAAPNELQRQDGQSFTATREAGLPQTQDAGGNGAGQLVTGALENSNVDLAKEFTKLIVAQRAYSANTKMVTTEDELLQQTIDMKR